MCQDVKWGSTLSLDRKDDAKSNPKYERREV